MRLNQFNQVDVTKPVSGRVVYKNAYWHCVNGDPTKALFYGTSPQCNENKKISESILKRLHNENSEVEIVFIETAFVFNRN